MRYKLNVYAFNPRALKAYEKAGSIAESVDKGKPEYDGMLIDCINMVLTRKRWEKINPC